MKTLLFYIILLLPACNAVAQPAAGDSVLSWPPAPDRSRIRFVESISSNQAFAQEGGGLFSKIVKFVFGGHEERTWLVQPVGIAISPKGVIAVADPGAHGIHFIDRAKKEYDFLGGTNEDKFLSPVGIAFAPDGSIYVSDSERKEIIVLDDDRDLKFVIRDSHLSRPTGVTLLSDKLYVTDSGNHTVTVFDRSGRFIMQFAGRGTEIGKFNFPAAITGRGDSVYVVDALNYRIESFSASGAAGRSFGHQGNAGGSFASPKSIALDVDGNMYVTDALMDNFQIFNAQGQLLLIVGRNGERAGQFLSPNGIAIDDANMIYVVDMLNRRIQIFEYLR